MRERQRAGPHQTHPQNHDVDLQKISTKDVRRKLVEEGYADDAFVEKHKPALGKLIVAVFNQATGVPGAEKVYESDEEA